MLECTEENVAVVDDPTISLEDEPQIHYSVHQIVQYVVTRRHCASERIISTYQYVVKEYGVSLYEMVIFDETHFQKSLVQF